MTWRILARVSCPALLSVVCGGAALAQTTWYVDAGATPPGAGTPASPFASIQYAIDRPTTVAGDTVLVAPGTYYESLSVFKTITVKSSHGPLATTLQSSVGLDGVHLDSDGAGPVFEGFSVHSATQISGIYVPSGTVRRCIVSDCTAFIGIECPAGRIESSIISRNPIGVVGAGLGVGTIRITNSVVWGNAQANLDPGATPVIESFNAGFGSPANGSLPGDPGFWDLPSSDFHLRPGSPCIDAGDPAGPLDPDGSRMDIGALVYDPTYAPGPSVYCTGKVNSQGCTPAIGSTGSASASGAGPFAISGTNVLPGKPALLLFGGGKSSTAFQGGVLCVAQPVKRLGSQISAGVSPCAGTLGFDMQAYVQSGVNPALGPGALASVQWWSRDPLDPAGFGSSLSDALFFGVAP